MSSIQIEQKVVYKAIVKTVPQSTVKSIMKQKRIKVKQKHTERKHETARYVFGILSKSKCVDCSERNPVLLEFDHVRGTKIDSISRMISDGYSKKKINEEIAKCEVRCVKCHRLKTAKTYGWYKWLNAPIG